MLNNKTKQYETPCIMPDARPRAEIRETGESGGWCRVWGGGVGGAKRVRTRQMSRREGGKSSRMGQMAIGKDTALGNRLNPCSGRRPGGTGEMELGTEWTLEIWQRQRTWVIGSKETLPTL